jgi:hypothetical protein
MKKTKNMRNILFGILTLFIISCGSNDAKKENKNNNSENAEFIWDFSKKKKFIYSYSQTVNGTNKMDKDRPADKSLMNGKGYLNVRVKENNLADLSLTDLEIDMIMFNENGTPKDTMSNKTPATVIQDMKPNGSFTDPNSNVMFDLLFPLPASDLKVGESDKISMQIPFNANGSRLFSKGFNELTFKGYETIEGRKCAVLKGKIDISELEIPEELKGEYKSSTTGLATYYFDLKNHYYVGADIQMLMEVMMDSETEDENDFGMFMEMTSDNVFKIRLEKIEE